MDLEVILAYVGGVLIVNGISLIPSIQGAIKEKHFTLRDRSVLNALLIAGNGNGSGESKCDSIFYWSDIDNNRILICWVDG
ncbi:MAG TPA: hypothetical protein HA232_04240 [Methanocellales archaeon]|nr:hypothetical protein [Methanocellales archaeon]